MQHLQIISLKKMQQYLIMEGDYVIGQFKVTSQPLGQGSFGKVFEGVHLPTSDRVAVKIINPKESAIALKKQEQIKEVEILKTVKSPNIVKYYDIYKREGNYLLFFEFCDSDLMKQIQKRSVNQQYLKEAEIIDILRQICEGFKILYQNKIIHRDVKPSNVLVSNGKYKIADFGFARFVNDLDEESDNTKLGSPIYTSPQILDRKKYSSKCDVWSLGILMYQLSYYKVPFDVHTTQELRKIVPKRVIVLPNEPKRSESFKGLINKMLKIEQKDRMDWPEIFLHVLVANNQPVDQLSKQAKEAVQRVLKLHKNICDYVSKVNKILFYHQYSIAPDAHMSGMLALNSYILYLSKLTIQFFFLKLFPHPSVSLQTWNRYKSTKYYWNFLKNMKESSSQIDNFIDELKQNLDPYMSNLKGEIKKAVIELIDKKYSKENYFLVMEWVIECLMKASSSPLFLIEKIRVCMEPLKSFNLETDFEVVDKQLEKEIRKYQSDQ